MKNRQQKGLEGENIAAGYLEARGYDLLERRYRFGHKEIDLIVRKGDLVVFVEVKNRRTEERSYVKPEEIVEVAEHILDACMPDLE